MMREEYRAFEAILLSILRFRSEERATAEQVLQSEWIIGWWLLALCEGQNNSNLMPKADQVFNIGKLFALGILFVYGVGYSPKSQTSYIVRMT